MNVLFWLFIYTPFPWLGILYIAAYRYEVSRVARPFRDASNLAAWWSVCTHLALIPEDTPRPATRRWVVSYFLAMMAAAVVSVFWMVKIVPLVWYYITILQVVSALILFIVLVRRIGSLPRRPYRDSLRYPRLGTRIRHLKEAGSEKYSLLAPAELPDQRERRGIAT